MLRRVAFGSCAVLICMTGFADEQPPAGISWKGSVSLGTELDEYALPQPDDEPPSKTPGRIRIGFTATWSFSLNWERVDPESDDAEFTAPEFSPEEAKLIELTNAERKKLKVASLEV